MNSIIEAQIEYQEQKEKEWKRLMEEYFLTTPKFSFYEDSLKPIITIHRSVS